MSQLRTKQIVWKDLTSGNPGFNEFGGVSLGSGKSKEQAKSKKTKPPGIYVTEKGEAMVVRANKWEPIWELGHILARGDYIPLTGTTTIGGGVPYSAHLLAYKTVGPFDAEFPMAGHVFLADGGDGLAFVLPGLYLVSITLSWASTATGLVDITLENSVDGELTGFRGSLIGDDVRCLSTFYSVPVAGASTLFINHSAGTAPETIVDFVFIRVSLNKA